MYMYQFVGASAAILASVASLVSAHGQIHSVEADGTTNEGPNIYYAADTVNSLTAVRTMYEASGQAYVLPDQFSDASAMSCEGASGAPKTLSVKPGDTVTVYWEGATSELLGIGGLTSYNPWVHAMGPIMDYIGSCNGDCSSADSSSIEWVKIADAGLDTSSWISDDLRNTMAAKPEEYYPTASQGAGLWAMAKMVQDGSKWDITVPSSLAPGQYIIRHEIAAIHSPGQPQLYIGCIQIDVSGSGTTNLPSGTKADQLYSSTDSSLVTVDVYSNPYSFTLPGPAVWDQVTSGSSSSSSGSSSSSSGSSSSSSSAPAATSSASAATSSASAATSSSSDSNDWWNWNNWGSSSSSSEAAAAQPTTQDAAVDATSTSADGATTTSTSAEAASTTSSAADASSTQKCRARKTKRGADVNKRHRRAQRFH